MAKGTTVRDVYEADVSQYRRSVRGMTDDVNKSTQATKTSDQATTASERSISRLAAKVTVGTLAYRGITGAISAFRDEAQKSVEETRAFNDQLRDLVVLGDRLKAPELVSQQVLREVREGVFFGATLPQAAQISQIVASGGFGGAQGKLVRQTGALLGATTGPTLTRVQGTQALVNLMVSAGFKREEAPLAASILASLGEESTMNLGALARPGQKALAQSIAFGTGTRTQRARRAAAGTAALSGITGSPEQSAEAFAFVMRSLGGGAAFDDKQISFFKSKGIDPTMPVDQKIRILKQRGVTASELVRAGLFTKEQVGFPTSLIQEPGKFFGALEAPLKQPLETFRRMQRLPGFKEDIALRQAEAELQAARQDPAEIAIQAELISRQAREREAGAVDIPGAFRRGTGLEELAVRLGIQTGSGVIEKREQLTDPAALQRTLDRMTNAVETQGVGTPGVQ